MQRFINNWSTVLTAPVTADIEDDQLSVASAVGDLLPALSGVDFIFMTLFEVDFDTGDEIRREVVRCTACVDGVLQVSRGWEGTEPQAWAAGMRIEARLTAESMAVLVADVAQLQRYRVLVSGAEVELNYQQGAFVLEPSSNAASLYLGFDYASEDKGAIQIDVEIYSPNSAAPFVLTVPTGNELLCELPAGSSVTTTEESTHEITLPAAELYVLEFRGLDNVRLRITTNSDYQLLA